MRQLKITPTITKRDSITFKQYLADIAKIKTFTPEEEYICGLKAHNGDEKAIRELITRNLRFVVSCAKQYLVKGVNIEDLINEGNIGLTCAARRYDPTKGFKFISYAVWWIRKDIQNYLSNHSRLVRLPINKIQSIKKYENMVGLLEQKLQRKVHIDDIIDAFKDDLNQEEISFLIDLSSKETLSLDKPIGDEDETSFYDIIPDESFGNVDDAILMQERTKRIRQMLTDLTPNQDFIIRNMYGFDGLTPISLDSIGKSLEISRERVRQIRDGAIKKLYKKYRNTEF